MKKLLFSFVICFSVFNESKACAWYDPDYEYFNLFAQDIIPNKEYLSFLRTDSHRFYESKNNFYPSENIESWQKYFDNKLSYDQTNALVRIVQLKHLVNWSKGNLTHELSKKLGEKFYTQYKEGIQYLIKAKELEPYMIIRYVEAPDSWYSYYSREDKYKHDATFLDYTKTSNSLLAAYNATNNKEIKLRYAYQLVRFNHYTLNYDKAISYFKSLVEPLKLKSPIYYYALDQVAGAQRGMKKTDEANGNFFQVFVHSRDLKQSAYISMHLGEWRDVNSLLSKAKTLEEKNMVYFLLAYNEYSNPIPMMEKMLANNADSGILKVLTSRAINQLERNLLPVYYAPCYDEKCSDKNKRLPIWQNTYYGSAETNYSEALLAFIEKVNNKSKDNFFQITKAYIQFLNKDYNGSQQTLDLIKTTDKDYLAQISNMKMLNEIVSQPIIDAKFEEILSTKYADVLSSFNKSGFYGEQNTKEFLRDILANRYLLQGEDAKSFLMNNLLSDIRYNPNAELAYKLETFYNKPNKTGFEKTIAASLNDVGNTQAFFNVIYGDHAMRRADFAAAKKHYEKATHFSGIPTMDWSSNSGRAVVGFPYKTNEYNGFKNIPNLIFGHNVWESFQSKPEVSMSLEYASEFSFIKNKMTKLELANALLELEKIGKGRNEKAMKANQLIGNVLYNTSSLGYFREIFVMDISNGNGPKFSFYNRNPAHFVYYYKNYAYDFNVYIAPDNFDLAINYYQKALNTSKNKEQKARLLFQMASAEQGKYYQWQTNEEKLNESEKMQGKQLKYRTYFAELKKNYRDTKTAEYLQYNCLYFNTYLN